MQILPSPFVSNTLNAFFNSVITFSSRFLDCNALEIEPDFVLSDFKLAPLFILDIKLCRGGDCNPGTPDIFSVSFEEAGGAFGDDSTSRKEPEVAVSNFFDFPRPANPFIARDERVKTPC
jgi:hypothetical protein